MSNENEKKEDSTKKNSSNENASSDSKNKSIYIIEGIIAAAAVIFIVVAIVIASKKNSDPNLPGVSIDAMQTSSDNQIADVLPGSMEMVEIDNSVLYENVPALPDAAEINVYDEADCEKLYNDGKMLKLENSDGSYVYVQDYTNETLLKSKVSYTEDEMYVFLYASLLSNFPVAIEDGRDVAELYDIVTIDYSGFLGEEQFEGGTATDQVAKLGAGMYIPGFEEGIVGMKVGDTKDVHVTFPADYRAENLAGKSVVFKITLKSIDGVPAEFTDELIAQNFTDISTKDEYTDYAVTQLLSGKAFDFLTEKFYVSDVNYDVALSYYNSTMDYYDAMSYQYQASIADMLEASDATVDDFKKDVMLTAADSALYVTMYQAIADDANITVSEEEILAMRDDYGFVDTQEFYDAYGEQAVKDFILNDKVIDYIISLSQDTEE